MTPSSSLLAAAFSLWEPISREQNRVQSLRRETAHGSRPSLSISTACCHLPCPALGSAAAGPAAWATPEAQSPVPSGIPTSTVAAVCVTTPPAGQPRCARGSLDVVGRVCVALRELHTWAVLRFPALKVPSAWGALSNPSWCMGHTPWRCPVPPHLASEPQNLPQPHGEHRLARLRSPGCSPKAQEPRDAQQEWSWRPRHPQTHARPPHCITASSAGCCEESPATSQRSSWDLSMTQSPREASPSPEKLSHSAIYCPSGMTVFLTVTGNTGSGTARLGWANSKSKRGRIKLCPCHSRGLFVILWICLVSVMPCRVEPSQRDSSRCRALWRQRYPWDLGPSTLSSPGGGNGRFGASVEVLSIPGPFPV